MLLARPRYTTISACPTLSPGSSPAWFAELRVRWTAHWALKTVFIPLFFVGFFAAYFQLLHHPLFGVTTVPVTALDRLIPFQPAALIPYLSLWFYVLLGAGTLRGPREIKVYCATVVALAVVGLGTFLLWPTTTPRPAIEWARYPSLQFLKNADAAGNACPSLHVAFSLFTAIWLEQLLRRIGAPVIARACNAVWAIAIVYSTIAIRQHVAIDVLVGAALGGFAGLYGCWPQAKDSRDLSSNPSWPGRPWLALTLSLGTKLALFTFGWHLVSPAVAVAIFVLPDCWILFNLLAPNTSGLLPTATHFATTDREVWVTIDDGPEPATTRPMLDLLDRHGAKATFFVIGAKAAAHPDLLAEIRQRGHTLGNHTQTHPLATFWLAGPRRTAHEIDRCDAVLRRHDEALSAWVRAPVGIKTFFLHGVLTDRNRVLIGWSARALENCCVSKAAPLRRLTKALRPGAILLLHESAPHAPEQIALLSALLDRASATGYRCVLPNRESLR